MTTQKRYVTDGNPDGNVIGQTSTEKISFWGATPAVRSALSNAAVDTTAATESSWGFSTSTQANAIVSLLNEIRAKLVSLGLTA